MPRQGRWTLGAVALCLVGILVAVPSADAGLQSFTSPGSFPFTVPVGVTSLHVVAVGTSGDEAGSDGGHGAEVSGDLAVFPGQALVIDVGAVDGADAGRGGGGSTTPGAAGGGASAIRISPGDLNARVIVAGGGGGGGGGAGAAGGDAGAPGAALITGTGGGAGGASSGGVGGAGQDGGTSGGAGAFGAGGSGGNSTGGGGGGGGGWFGGGGGGGGGLSGNGGGGGGSNYAGAGVTNFSQHLAASFGNGSVLLSWTPSNEFGIGKLTRNLRKGTAKLTVTVPGPGTLTLSGKGLIKQRPASLAVASRVVSAAGRVKLLIKAKGGKGEKLTRNGRVRVKAKLTYTPTDGAPNTESKQIKLRKRL